MPTMAQLHHVNNRNSTKIEAIECSCHGGEGDAGTNLVTPDCDKTTKRLKTMTPFEKRVALPSVNFCTELLPDGDLNNDHVQQNKLCCANCCSHHARVQVHQRKMKPRSEWRQLRLPCKKMWTIEVSTLKRPDEIKLKKEMDFCIANSDFVDTGMSVASDDPMEQPPEQTQAPHSGASVASDDPSMEQQLEQTEAPHSRTSITIDDPMENSRQSKHKHHLP